MYDPTDCMKPKNTTFLLLFSSLLLGSNSLAATPIVYNRSEVIVAREVEYPAVTAPDPQRFPPNPLGQVLPDPLLSDPQLLLEPRRSLNDLEKEKLRSALDRLHIEGQTQFSQKKSDEAFLIWFRELRLRRVLGFREEIFALAKIGEIAWQNNRTRDLRDITERLQVIQIKIQPQSNPATPSPIFDEASFSELNEYLAIAYQVLRAPQLALSIYEPRLQSLRSNALPNSLPNNPIELFKTLNSIGLIHLDWFRYTKAQQIYLDLRELSRLAQNPASEALYLIQLTYIAEQNNQPKDAIGPLQDLIILYAAQPAVQPALTLRLAENYDKAQDLGNAEKNYQTTFTVSQTLSQNSYGSSALFALGDLYRRTDRFPAAEQVYDFLVDSEQAVYNLHNAMKASDSLGQMRDRQQNYPGAIAAYEQATAIAQRLAISPDLIQPLRKRLEIARKKSKLAPQIVPRG
ncbi:MAG: tetratricopeptide repeat protein [Alkalinema sp. CAN_BIN05]|nr:tetratricopeptide repeat protein [Alkalinema sp. CAN_BIN05]